MPVPALVSVTPVGVDGALQLVEIGNCILDGRTDGPVPVPVTTLVITIVAAGVFDEHDQLFVTVIVCVALVMVIGPAGENTGGLQVMVPWGHKAAAAAADVEGKTGGASLKLHTAPISVLIPTRPDDGAMDTMPDEMIVAGAQLALT